MVRIDERKCTGCGVCTRICPAGFVMKNSLAAVKSQTASCIKAAAEACPVQAIIIDTAENAEALPIKSKPLPTEKAGLGLPGSQNQTFGSGRGLGGGGMGGRASGGGRGRNQGRGLGMGGYCICPNCGYQEPHQRGVPCYEMRCPKCNAVMYRG